MEHSNKNRFITIGLMLFALFFGAGNLIFPAAMGQVAGENLGWALLGFCITGVGLPLLGVMAIGYSGCHDLHQVANRVHPMFGIFYTIVCYMAIGPCFAVPRTGTVSFEIAVRPFLAAEFADIALPIFLAVFFAIAFWLSASPSKIVDRVGKFLTPLLVLALLILIVKSIITPLGAPQAASANYATPVIAAVQGVLDGYNTLDAIASLVFATLVVTAVKEAGFENSGHVAREVYKSGLLAGAFLAVIYIFIARIGADSVGVIGLQDTGAPVLTKSAQVLLGDTGAMVLAVIVLLACLTTAIGLITCCSIYFRALTGRFSYVTWCALFTVVSYLIGLFGLKTIIVSTIPVLMFIYPLCVALIALVFLHKFFGGRQCVYAWTVGLTFIMAAINGLETAKVPLGGIETFLQTYVPLHTVGLGWIPFAVVGFVIGFIQKSMTPAKA